MDRSDWDERYATPELIWTAEPNQFLVREVGDLPPGRAVDLACGEGRNAIWLAELGWETTGVDFSRVALDKAQQFAERRETHVQWVEADLTEWTPDPGRYDLVLLAYVQLPSKMRGPLHRVAFDAVRPGGRLLIIAHDSTNLTAGFGGPQSPDVLFSPEDVFADIDGADFVIERAERVSRSITTDLGARVAIDALVRLQKPMKERETINGNH